MNVELHWYMINTVYIGYQFSNILLKKCKGLIIGKLIYTRQMNYFQVATLLPRKTRMGENGVRLDKNFLFAIFLVVFTFFLNFFRVFR